MNARDAEIELANEIADVLARGDRPSAKHERMARDVLNRLLGDKHNRALLLAAATP